MRRDERGLTLTEVTIVGVIAVLVMLTLTSFYFNSQRTWLESSTKAVAQREATLITEHLAEHVREAGSYFIDDSDSLHHTLTLLDAGGVQSKQFAWADGFVLEDGLPGRSISTSRVERFQFTALAPNLVELARLELLSANGEKVQVSSRFKLYNR